MKKTLIPTFGGKMGGGGGGIVADGITKLGETEE
jgi:hypothetical protein